ncbi:uncharacterized protein I206_103007 [Kwoniella pini CBS 10737]|uniref:Uncharacterized protein n=1 Tax=Kwoniella pini CBS 10737 TaxID=1296096 RepID=A0A1B9IB62_9TREE|nr:uncharacterized protein I206_01987 [Kwoniella pini CBS 10737]OCF52694.1 hypothetical protein I206_01987 [Kwoniella pini CBS 10737]
MAPSSSKMTPLSPVHSRSPVRSPPATLDQAAYSLSLSLSVSAMESNNQATEPQARPPRFYLPSTSNSSPRSSPVAPLSRVQSRNQGETLSSGFSLAEASTSPHVYATANSHSIRRVTSNGSNGSGLYARRSSKASISNLRSALEVYQIHPNTSLPQALLSPEFLGDAGGPSSSHSSQNDQQKNVQIGQEHNQDRRSDVSCNDSSDRTSHTHHSSISSDDLGHLKMDALVDIHRVLYRGKEDLQVRRIELCLKEELQQVRRVVERWFESDCIYEQPLVRLTSRDSMLMHFALLHLFGAVYIPSFTPFATIIHIQELVHLFKTFLLGKDYGIEVDQQIKPTLRTTKSPRTPNPGREEHLLGLGLGVDPPTRSLPNTHKDRRDYVRSESDLITQKLEEKHDHSGMKVYKGWWKLWDITAECKEIGEMECYDGHYLALIEHVLRLSLFPNFRSNSNHESSDQRHPSAYFHPNTQRTDSPHIKGHYILAGKQGIPALPLPSLAKRFLRFLWDQVECWLDWDLRVNTMVQFNEVGKATHIRDVVDIRDLIEFIVPFAKRLRWITKLIGIFTSMFGAILLTILEDHKEANPKSTVKAVQVTMQRQRSQPILAPQSVRLVEKYSAATDTIVPPMKNVPIYGKSLLLYKVLVH